MPKSDATIGMTSETGDRGIPALYKDNDTKYQVGSLDVNGYVKSATSLIDNTGATQGVKFVDGKPRVSAMPYLYDIAEGNIPNHISWNKIGFNGDIDNVTEDLISQGGIYIFPTIAAKMDLVSSSVNDDGSPAGSGARTVTIYGLLSDYSEASETLTLNGTTPVQTVNSYLRINNMRVATAGASGLTEGNITLSETGGTTFKYGYIAAGFTRQRQMIYTVPIGKTLYLTSITVSGVNTSVGHWCRFTTRANYDDKSGLNTGNVFIAYHEILVVDQSFERNLEIPTKFSERTDIRIQAISDAGSSNEICSCALRGWLE